MATIDATIAELCGLLDAKYINFFHRSTLDNTEIPGVRTLRYLFVTGTYACNAWQRGDDVHLVCLTYTTERLFWEVVAEKLEINDTANMITDSAIELSSPALSRTADGSPGFLSNFVTLSRGEMAGSRFYLHYCRAPGQLKWKDITTGDIEAYGYETTSPAVERNLNMIRDMQQLRRWSDSPDDINSATPFDEAVRNLCSWAKTHGIVGEKLHFLGNESFIWVVHGAYLHRYLAADRGEHVEKSPDAITNAIFEHFDSLCHLRVVGKCSSIRQVDIRTPTEYRTTPQVTGNTSYAIETAVRTMRQIEKQPTESAKTPYGPLAQLLSSYTYAVKVSIECFDPTNYIRFEEEIVPNNVNIVARCISKRYHPEGVKGIVFRLWPVPIQESHGSWTYAILLEASPLSLGTEGQSKKYAGSIIDSITENELEYASTDGLVSLSLHSAGKLKAQLLKDLCSDDALVSRLDSLQMSSVPAENRRFRTFNEAIQRLLHDERHAGAKFDLGYEDRFKGLMWMPMEKWGKKATEEEDFIPEHRVRLLRRRSDGWVIWDRREKEDLTHWRTSLY